MSDNQIISQENCNIDKFTFQIDGNTLTLNKLDKQMDEQFEFVYRAYAAYSVSFFENFISHIEF